MLCRLMADHQWTRRDLSLALPLPEPELARYMRGDRALSPYWLVRIGTVLQLTDAQFRTLAEGVAMLEYARWSHAGNEGYRRYPLAEAAFTRQRSA